MTAGVLVDALLTTLAVATAGTAVRRHRLRRNTGEPAWAAFTATVEDMLPAPVAAVVLLEATTLHALWLAVRRRQDGVRDEITGYGYAQGRRAFFVVMLGVSAAEVVALHVMIPWPGARAVLDVLGAYSALLVLGFWAVQHTSPHLLGAHDLELRSGHRVVGRIPLHVVDEVTVRRRYSSGTPAVDGERLHLPNAAGATEVELLLREAVPVAVSRRRVGRVRRVSVGVDDPDALRGALDRVLTRS